MSTTTPTFNDKTSETNLVNWKVEGMDCTNCALTISKYLEKKGQQQIKVNFIGGEVSFLPTNEQQLDQLKSGIEDLGYKVINEAAQPNDRPTKKPFFSSHLHRFLFCLPFTAILMMHMIPWPEHSFMHHLLMNPWIQMAICLPVFWVGMGYFGVSAVKSIFRGIPNMNVLIAVGATAAFVYSFIGTVMHLGMDYIFYETTATIITLVFLGEFAEHYSVSITQRALDKLGKQQKVMANMIAFDDQHQEVVFPVENNQLRHGDLILLKTGEQVPTDCKILWGELQVSEALLTGESKPLQKVKKDTLIGGSVIVDGTAKAQVTAVGEETVLSNILRMVKNAQAEKPPVQQLADKISAIFVPVVISIAILTFVINYWVVATPFSPALMRSIAVLVISCPCAMGLATPAAIAVGLGRGARNGILFRNARSLELFKNIKTVVFDKTGTLTKGQFSITGFHCIDIEEQRFKQLVFSIEKYSNHPIAKSIQQHWASSNPIFWSQVEEIKGKGVQATDTNGNVYLLGSYEVAKELTTESQHKAYLIENGKLLGWLDVDDEIRPEAATVIQLLHRQNIKTVLLSGDSVERTQQIANLLGIQEVYGGKSPAEKLTIIDRLNQETPTAMVGDGINDAPALAKATIGISMSDASHLAMQSAQVVLMNTGIQYLPMALGLGKATYQTIKGNLFWAFIYNIVAIPIAAAGFLNPGIAALTMGLSDVVLALNSIRLNYKKVV